MRILPRVSAVFAARLKVALLCNAEIHKKSPDT
jgi:hypothetical protein